MDMSFYTAALGARAQQEKMNVVANNVANVNSTGYLAKNAVFSDLIYYNMKNEMPVTTDIQAGSGVIVQRTDTNFNQGTPNPTENWLDFAIMGRGFFMLEDPLTKEVTYSRDGNFMLSDSDEGFRLVTSTGKIVLDADREHIILQDDETLGADPGIFDFPILNGMLSIGNNELVPVEKNGEPVVSESAELWKGYQEMNNVDLSDEIVNVIEASRAYSYALKMVLTSDQIEETINRLSQ